MSMKYMGRLRHVKIVALDGSIGHWTPMKHCCIDTFSQRITVIIYFQQALLPTYIMYIITFVLESKLQGNASASCPELRSLCSNSERLS